MSANVVIYGALSLGILGLLMGSLLILAHNKIALPPNEKVKALEEVLPGINCGACGYPGCAGYAEAVVTENIGLNLCSPGGQETIEEIAKIVGAEVPDLEKQIAYIHCGGKSTNTTFKYEYHGILECSQAELLFQGAKTCKSACLGLGSCYRACPFAAIELTSEMLVRVNPHKCTGCGLCIEVCPRDVIALVPYREKPVVYQVRCKSHEKALNVRQQCQVGCIACTLCIKKCPVDAIKMEDNLAIIDVEKCVGCTQCEKVCPTKAINHIKKEKHHLFHHHDEV